MPFGSRDSSLPARFVFRCSFSCTGVSVVVVPDGVDVDVDVDAVVVELVVVFFDADADPFVVGDVVLPLADAPWVVVVFGPLPMVVGGVVDFGPCGVVDFGPCDVVLFPPWTFGADDVFGPLM